MKLSYSTEDVERWRDRKHRRRQGSAVTNERQALAFINSVGFCLASRADSLELPNLWDAVSCEHTMNGNGTTKRSYYLSYAWEIQNVLPNHGSVYYGKVFKRRPSIISREFFPCFYSLSGRTGARDEHKTAELSSTAKLVMDKLLKSSPMTSKELRESLSRKGKHHVQSLDKALDELQRKMFICRLVGTGHQFGAAWAIVAKCFAPELRKAQKISLESARQKVLQKHFENQLMCSVDAIRHVFGWQKKVIYQTLGRLVGAGAITPTIALDGKKGSYCLIH